MTLLTRFCLAISALLILSATSAAQDHYKIITGHKRAQNVTTVKMAPVKISGDKDKYHSLHISPSFSYPGHQATVPEHIHFELQTIVKGKLRVDLYVVFIVDGETIFLSSSRRGVERPVPGRRWMGELLVFRMPYKMFLKMAAAKAVAVKLDAVRFEFGETPMQALRDFAKLIDAPVEMN